MRSPNCSTVLWIISLRYDYCLPLFHLDNTSPNSFVPPRVVNRFKKLKEVPIEKKVSFTPLFNNNASYNLFSGSTYRMSFHDGNDDDDNDDDDDRGDGGNDGCTNDKWCNSLFKLVVVPIEIIIRVMLLLALSSLSSPLLLLLLESSSNRLFHWRINSWQMGHPNDRRNTTIETLVFVRTNKSSNRTWSLLLLYRYPAQSRIACRWFNCFAFSLGFPE